MRFPGFVGASYKAASINVDCQRSVNLIPETTQSGRGKEQEVSALIPTPGLRKLCFLPGGVFRGAIQTTRETCFAVGGNKLYSISDLFVPTEIGTLQTSAGMVSFADNGLQLMVVDGTYGYSYDFTTLLFSQIADPDFPGADVVTFQDGYFLFNYPNSGKFGLSDLYSVTFDALDVATSEGSPDDVVSLISHNRKVWILNKRSTEVFYNTGDADRPSQRSDGAFLQIGCAARFSVAKTKDAVFWLSQNEEGVGEVYRATGLEPQKISTHAVEREIQSYENFSDAVAYTYQEDGHTYYVLNFPSARTTWAFDEVTNLWHERVFQKEGVLDRHRSNGHIFAFGKHVVGDFETGDLYEMKSDIYSDFGIEIVRERITPHASSDGNPMFYKSFTLDIESGVGLDGIQQGTDPQAMLSWSDDGGHTWSNEQWKSFGKIGKTRARAIWRRLGRSRDRVFKIRISDPVKVVLVGASLDIEVGRG